MLRVIGHNTSLCAARYCARIIKPCRKFIGARNNKFFEQRSANEQIFLKSRYMRLKRMDFFARKVWRLIFFLEPKRPDIRLNNKKVLLDLFEDHRGLTPC